MKNTRSKFDVDVTIVVPALFSVRCRLKFAVSLMLMFSVAPAAMFVVPTPPIVPPVQVAVLLNVTTPLPPRMPDRLRLDSVTLLLKFAVPAMVVTAAV